MTDGPKSERARRYRDPQIRKQVSIFLPASDWQALRDEAVRQRRPVTELCRRWIRPELDRLRQGPPTDDGDRAPRRLPEDRRSRRED